MQSLDKVKLRLYWEGPYTLYGNDIGAIDLNIEGSTHDVSGKLNKNTPSNVIQKVSITINPTDKPWETRTNNSLLCPPELARLMTISIRTFESYTNRSHVTLHPNGRKSYEQRSRMDIKPVIITQYPIFEPGQTYQIKVVNGDKLTATITKKMANVSKVNKDRINMPLGQLTEDELRSQLRAAEDELQKAAEQLYSANNPFDRMIASCKKMSAELHLKNLKEIFIKRGINLN